VAAIVVALVVAFIAWLAMADRDGDAVAGDAPSTSATNDDAGAGDGAGTEADADTPTAPTAPTQPAPDAATQTPPPEVQEFMLGLQRRDADDPMAIGDVDAPVVMIEYADYRCPYCASFHLDTRPELAPLVEDGTLRIEFRDLVIFDETSRLAALAGRAAAEQGHLEAYQNEVFALSREGHGEYDREDLISLADEVGVEDLDAFETALDDADLQAAVDADTAEARAIGVTSTPTFLINTQVVQGAYPLAYFEEVIEAEAAKVDAG
jgi:protein-disulfide isomerase